MMNKKAGDAAMRTIERRRLVFLSRWDRQRFVAELIAPSPLSPAMERAVRRYKELIGPFE